MKFRPIFDSYIQIATASYVEPSSSIGALGLQTIQNNLEWDYHFMNSQTRVNYIPGIPQTATLLVLTSSTDYTVGSVTPLHTVGPFRINLDYDGNPTPMFFAISAKMYTPAIMSGSFVGVLRAAEAGVSDNLTDVGTFFVSGVDNRAEILLGANAPWNTFDTPYASYISASFGVSSSIFQTGFARSGLNAANSKLIRTSETLDSKQPICLAYFDISFRVDSYSGGSGTSDFILYGLYGREVNVI